MARPWRFAIVAVCLFGIPPAYIQTAARGADLGQGWDQTTRDQWYEGTQGSRLVPWAWAEALERPEGGGRFFDAANLARYRFLPPEPTSHTGKPVGFLKDDGRDGGLEHTGLRWYAGQDDREPWLGLNCSACHTAEIRYKTNRVRVDGGPGMGDFQSFVEDFDRALSATRDDPQRFDRFATAVLGERMSPDNGATLRAALGKLSAWEDAASRLNGKDVRYGFARLDAFGRIFNKVVLFTHAPNPIVNPADAPVSIPFLWNTHQANVVQWNGIATNDQLKIAGHDFDYGALGRNVGEVLGVFGETEVTPRPGLGGYRSSVQTVSLVGLENVLRTLRPPAWPVALFGPIDEPLRADGDRLFDEHCQTCHAKLARTDLATPFTAPINLFRAGVDKNVPPGTDIWMACNAVTYAAKTGDFENTPSGIVDGPPIGATEKVATLLRVAVTGTIAGQKGAVVAAAVQTFLGVDLRPRIVGEAAALAPTRDQRRALCMAKEDALLGYKSRPLTGIWATAPYLHNGSVPTLDDLLQPPGARPAKFNVGTREYDPVRMGFLTQPSADNSFAFDTTAQGNSNAGHDYGNAQFTPEKRRAILEYLKSL